MNKIITNKTTELVINKSRFITCLFKVNSENEVSDYLNQIKNEYKNATHYCYAYIIDDIKRYNDDNEPTAGIPILNTLESNNLNYVLCIIVRYFGGIKLGVGGLARAYGNSCLTAIKDNLIPLVVGYQITVKFNYDQINQIDYLLKGVEIIDKNFSELVSYTFLISDKLYKNIENKLSNLCQIESIINKSDI